MAKLLPSVLFGALMMIGCTNQEVGAESTLESGDKTLQKGWLVELQDSFTYSKDKDSSVLTMAVYLLMGGVLALYIRFLYRHCNASVSNSDSVARIFPLLTMVTIGVIAVVKSSLALSLGAGGGALDCALSGGDQGSGGVGLPVSVHRRRLDSGRGTAAAGDRDGGGCDLVRAGNPFHDGQEPAAESAADDYRRFKAAFW